MKLEYTSDYYMGPRIEFFARTFLVARGEIAGSNYTYAEFADEEEVQPGDVPEWFKETAQLAFGRVRCADCGETLSTHKGSTAKCPWPRGKPSP